MQLVARQFAGASPFFSVIFGEIGRKFRFAIKRSFNNLVKSSYIFWSRLAKELANIRYQVMPLRQRQKPL
jgi:hypothetical protein